MNNEEGQNRSAQNYYNRFRQAQMAGQIGKVITRLAVSAGQKAVFFLFSNPMSAAVVIGIALIIIFTIIAISFTTPPDFSETDNASPQDATEQNTPPAEHPLTPTAPSPTPLP